VGFETKKKTKKKTWGTRRGPKSAFWRGKTTLKDEQKKLHHARNIQKGRRGKKGPGRHCAEENAHAEKPRKLAGVLGIRGGSKPAKMNRPMIQLQSWKRGA